MVNISAEQLEILNKKAQEVNLNSQELLDLMIDFFGSMPKSDIEFLFSSSKGCSCTEEECDCSNDTSCCGRGCCY